MTDTPAAPAHPDNLFGICAALGKDFGFNPLWLRVALAAGLLWRPDLVVGAYLALGVLVLASRLLFPDRNAPAMPAAPVADNDAGKVELAQAA